MEKRIKKDFITCVSYQDTEALQYRCQLKIPNQEVLAQYISIFKRYLEDRLGD